MKNKNLNEMSNEALLKQQKSMKFLTGVLIGVLLVSLVGGVVSAFKSGQYTSLIIPFALLPIVFLSFNTLKEIKKEVNSRGNIL